MLKLFFTILFLLFTNTFLKSQVFQDWVQRYGNQGDGIYTTAGPVVDNNGNVFVAGSVTGASLTDYVTIKYNSAGIEQWSRIYTGQIEDRLIDMTLDHNGNVFVTGLSENLTGTYDIITIKYDTNGDSLWVKRYNGATAFTMDQPVAMTVDKNNNIFVLGYSFGTIPLTLVTIKYNQQGDSLWVQRFIEGGTNLPRDIFADMEGNTYVYSRGTRILKYDPEGTLLWNKIYSFDASETNNAITGDANGNIYFTATKGTSTFGDFAVVKLNSNGDTVWTRVRNGFGGTTATHDDANAICFDNNGNVFITGKIYDLGVINFSTIKYDAAGTFQWEKNYFDPQNGEGGADIAADASGNIYVTGGSNDFVTIKYDTNGDSLWIIRYNGTANFIDISSGLTIDNSGHVFVCGKSRFNISPGNFEIATVKYSQTITNISNGNNSPKSFLLYQNYPNPFNPTTNLEFEISSSFPSGSESGFVSLKIFDNLGKEIVTLVNETRPPGTHSVTFSGNDLASGIYYYSLFVNGDLIDTKKMILLK